MFSSPKKICPRGRYQPLSFLFSSLGECARLDVPADACQPEMRRQRVGRYFSTLGGDYQASKEKMRNLAKDVFAPLMK